MVQEFARVAAPVGTRFDINGSMVGLLLLEHSTQEQRDHFLPRILSGEYRWCLGLSEPNAGSDLASLRTRATLTGDTWVVNGQKVWTSQAQLSTWMLLLARTGAADGRHEGLTLLLLPMEQDAVTVRPIRTTTADLVVGGEGNGWSVVRALLGLARGDDMLIRHPLQMRNEFDKLRAFATQRGLANDPMVRQSLAHLYTKVTILGLLAARISSGDVPAAYGSSLFKLSWSGLHKELSARGMQLLGPQAMVISGTWPIEWGPDFGPAATLEPELAGIDGNSSAWIADFLISLSGSIYAGTDQIQRNLVGELGLGLPR
jgi:alkylation response protein AidB-like acyl-CoA dehydrogenase